LLLIRQPEQSVRDGLEHLQRVLQHAALDLQACNTVASLSQSGWCVVAEAASRLQLQSSWAGGSRPPAGG
jgi:hypothetical protein